MIILPTKIVNLLPRVLSDAYVDALYLELLSLGGEMNNIQELLENDISPGYEYTDGFRDHLMRRLRDGEKRGAALAEAISAVPVED
jgi:hypothetical protein